MAERKKIAAKRTGERKTVARRVVIAGFSDLPQGMLEKHRLPAKLANRGFYCTRLGYAKFLFEKYPESKLPTKVAKDGLGLVHLVARRSMEQIQATVGGDDDFLDSGFHADLDARALAQAFEEEGFRIEPFPISIFASLAVDEDNPWPAASTLLKSGDVKVGELLGSMYAHADLQQPSDAVLSLLAKHVTTRDELVQMRRIVNTSLQIDTVACALPFVAKLWKPKRAKKRPKGLPAALTTLLAAFDGIPAINVWNPEQIAKQHERLLAIAKNAKGVGKRDWGASPREIRTDRFWRERWIPLCQRPNDQYIAIDLDPTKQGTKGQIIGVHLNPPTLTRYRSTLGEWLWNELESAIKG